MANLLTGRNLAIVGGGIVGISLLSRTRTAQKIDPIRSSDSNPMETNSVANVTKRFTAAGGTPEGTPAQSKPTSTQSNLDTRGDYSHSNTFAQKDKSSGGEQSTSKSNQSGQDAGPPVQPGKQGTEGRKGTEQHHGNMRDVGAAQAG